MKEIQASVGLSYIADGVIYQNKVLRPKLGPEEKATMLNSPVSQ